MHAGRLSDISPRSLQISQPKKRCLRLFSILQGTIYIHTISKTIMCYEGKYMFLQHKYIIPETETLNNFCPARFSQVCPGFHFLQKGNLDKNRCPDF